MWFHHNITIQRYILIYFNLIYMLILISKTIFISIYIPLVVIFFNASA
jgi:hypothetical protein